jgi:hypothetical protein
VKRGGGGAGLAYAATRDGRRVLVLHAAPRLDAHLIEVAHVLPSQVPRRHAVYTTGTRALLGRLLALALLDAGWKVDGRSTPPHPSPRRHRIRWQTRRTLARRWLCGELEDQVAVPVRLVCDLLGIDVDALAAVVRRAGAQALLGRSCSQGLSRLRRDLTLRVDTTVSGAGWRADGNESARNPPHPRAPGPRGGTEDRTRRR